jgi:hypothetical protein
MLRKKWRLLKMFLCFKMLTKSLKVLCTIIGKKTVSEILYFTGRNLQSSEETSCDMKKPPVTVRNLLSQEETSCQTKKHLKIDIQKTVKMALFKKASGANNQQKYIDSY